MKVLAGEEMQRKEIAIYGKGGIGKSTVSANLSVALAASGVRVLQIGCDPKHDSTRLIMGGRSIPTVLDYLRVTPTEQARTHSILHTGALGIGCIEAGGPKPGVGCAGRGIISAFEFLDRNHAKDGYDVIMYDVLGDVVCGGFAVPIRREYADAIFIVTSGEFMALYAANNILRGIRNYDGSQHQRVAGIIFNARNLQNEDVYVQRFADAVKLPIVATVPRSRWFSVAEQRNCTLMELPEEPDEQEIFRKLAKRVADGPALFEALPLNDDDLEKCILHDFGNPQAARIHDTERTTPCTACQKPGIAGSSVQQPPCETNISSEAITPLESSSPHEANTPDDAAGMQTTASDDSPTRPALYGCAFNGAVVTAIHLTDAIVIAHSPRSCAFYAWQTISSPGRRNLFHRGTLLPSAISPNFEYTQIDRHEAVFGSTDKLREHVQNALERKPGAIVVISSCVSGIMGDDVLSVEELSTPQTPVMVIKADGDIAGDYMEGIRMCLHKLAESIVDPMLPPRQLTVNLIGETGVDKDLDRNERARAIAWYKIRQVNATSGKPKGVTFHVDGNPSQVLAYGAFLKDYLGMTSASPEQAELVFADANLIAELMLKNSTFCGIEINQPTMGYIDLVPKTHLGVQGALLLVEQALNGLMSRL